LVVQIPQQSDLAKRYLDQILPYFALLRDLDVVSRGAVHLETLLQDGRIERAEVYAVEWCIRVQLVVMLPLDALQGGYNQEVLREEYLHVDGLAFRVVFIEVNLEAVDWSLLFGLVSFQLH
jgi:hypothetical protein